MTTAERYAAEPRVDERYARLAVLVHWVTAALVVTGLLLALWLEQRTGAERGQLIRLHKSVGLTILFVSVLRVACLAFLPRPAPISMTTWERRTAAAVHTMAYVLLISIPISGWAMISADSGKMKTFWFGWLYWPKIQALADLPPALRLKVHGVLAEVHLTLALSLVALLVLHIAAVGKHEFGDNVRQLRRMSWKGRT